MIGRRSAAAACALLAGTAMPGAAAQGQVPAQAAKDAPAPKTLAERFGARENVRQISMSPDGGHLAVLTSGGTRGTALVVIDADKGETSQIAAADGDGMQPRACGWSSPTRLVCKLFGTSDALAVTVGFTRLIGLDADGGHRLYLGRKPAFGGGLRPSQFDGDVIDWRIGDGQVLMARDFVPEASTTGSIIRAANARDGLGVELVDTVNGKAQLVERPDREATDYLADGQGNVRIKAIMPHDGAGMLTGETIYRYRPGGGGDWQPFSRVRANSGDALAPLAVDGTRNVAFATRTLNGRAALYSVTLDGAMTTELVASNPDVDVASVVTIGRRGRVIGATYVTDRRQTDYFDSDYRKLAAGLARALPRTPLIRFVGANADESQLLVFAGSDVDPGTYYRYTKATRRLDALVGARPQLSGVAMGEMKAVRFPAADGTMVPAYLTLPPGGAAKGLPAIVMPHGGPSSRDEWGFDWLVQFFAASGYAVIQPQYRGSSGYGDGWYANNAFRSWEQAINDVADAGRWLVREGIADPRKLGIVGWSYGGYAALQANVIDPDLFRAGVAIAPVTDLAATKREAIGFTNRTLVAEQIGSGEAVAKGSPARHADRFKAPVLMFHGDTDLNVGVAQSRLMDKRLRDAGKASTLVVFPRLDHQIDDSAARSAMLAKSDAFLKAAFGG